MPRVVNFPNTEPVWSADREAVRFYAVADRTAVPCFVTGPALVAHFGTGDLTAGEALAAFSANRTTIREAARRKIEAGGLPKGGEVVLGAGDFPGNGRLRPPERDDGFDHVESEAVRRDAALAAGIAAVNAVLGQFVARGHFRVTAEWDAVSVPADEDAARLVLTDPDTGASVEALFTRDDLGDLATHRLPLFRLYDDFLRERIQRLMDRMMSAAGTEG